MAKEFPQIGVLAAALSTDVREAARLARSNGFAGIQLDAVSPLLDVTTLSQTGRRELIHVLSSNDQQLIGLSADAGPKGFGPGADIDRILSAAQKIMEAAKSLGAPLVCIDAGPLPEPEATAPPPRVTPQDAGLIIIPTPPPPPKEGRPVPGPDPAVLSHIDNALTALGTLADRIGVPCAFRSDLASFAAINRALTAAKCPSFGVDLDPVAILRDDWLLDEIFSRLGPLVRHVRARDALAGANGRTKPAPIGQGSTHWPELLAALDAASYRGWITIDPLELPDRTAAAIAAAKHIRASAP